MNSGLRKTALIPTIAVQESLIFSVKILDSRDVLLLVLRQLDLNVEK